MAPVLMIQEACPRCKKGSGSPRQVSPEEMREVLDGLSSPEPDDEEKPEGITLTLGSGFDFSPDGGTAKYAGKTLTLKGMCQDCRGTVLDNVVSIMRDTKLTPEQNPHRKTRGKKEEVAADGS